MCQALFTGLDGSGTETNSKTRLSLRAETLSRAQVLGWMRLPSAGLGTKKGGLEGRF